MFSVATSGIQTTPFLPPFFSYFVVAVVEISFAGWLLLIALVTVASSSKMIVNVFLIVGVLEAATGGVS